MKSFNPGWRVIYTKPRHERKVCSRLTELHIQHFFPIKKSIRTWHDRKKVIDAPLFPSYVFVYLNSMQEYYSGMDAAGVLYYVRYGKEIARVNESVIDNIKLAAGQVNDVEISEERFEPGQRLVVREGALTGLCCEVVQANDKQKLLVRVELLQRNILLTMPSENLIAV